jgi:flagellar L-ring protein precursor FlgH
VFSNGHLEVLGQKKLTLSQGDEYIRIKGMVRPSDISPSNVVNSDRLANAEITYIGTGQVSEANKRGWFARLLTVALPL